MMTITMLLCLLNLAWRKTAGKSKGFQLFQQYDDDYEDFRFVEYCPEKQLERIRAFNYSNKMMAITRILGLLNIVRKNSWA